MQGPIVGLVGDAFTLVGGLLLAWDAIQKEKEVDEIKANSNKDQGAKISPDQIHYEWGGNIGPNKCGEGFYSPVGEEGEVGLHCASDWLFPPGDCKVG